MKVSDLVIKIVQCPLSMDEVYRRLARHSPRAEANIAKACNSMQWSHKILDIDTIPYIAMLKNSYSFDHSLRLGWINEM